MILDRNVRAILSRESRMRKAIRERDEVIVALSRAGMLQKEIGMRYGISVGRVRQILQREKRREKWRELHDPLRR
jgi:transposase